MTGTTDEAGAGRDPEAAPGRSGWAALGALLFSFRHRVKALGLQHWHAVKGAVAVANHVSDDDALHLAIALPEDAVLVLTTRAAATRAGKRAALLRRTLVVDLEDPGTLKTLVKEAKAGARLVTFPEVRPSLTGALDKTLGWPATVADLADVPLLPIVIEGAALGPASRLVGRPTTARSRVSVKVLPSRPLPVIAGLRGAARREAFARVLSDTMIDAAFEARPLDRTLPALLVDTAETHGFGREVLEDADRAPLAYRRIVLGMFVLGRELARLSERGERVGVLLPNSAGALVTFFGLQAFGRVPAMLNFSAGPAALVSAVETARIGTVLTSRRFVEIGKFEASVAAIGRKARVVYLEDVRAGIGTGGKLLGLLRAHFPRAALATTAGAARAGDAAVVLFTSGSEGVPKGVVLSHANLAANCWQILAIADFGPSETVFNALPVFHSFGLTAASLMPILGGLKLFMYPSPLHTKIVPALVHETGATLVFGTDTFLSAWGRNAEGLDFRRVRTIVSGGEKVKPETRQLFMEEHGAAIFEGYGVTEAAPVLCCNTPANKRVGSVGRFLPHVEHRLEEVAGIPEGGRLHVKAPNVMLGYLRNTAPGVLEPLTGGWYDTGDIVKVDEDGFVTILGRAKRFAKLGGEMVSLVAAEARVAELWPETAHAIVSVPDAKKGEALVLVTTNADADVRTLLAAGRAKGVPELMLPRTIVKVDELPLLGSGKTDYVSIQTLALARSVETAEEA